MTRPTSRAALSQIAPDTARIRRKVYAFIVARGPQGATCDEIETSLALAHQTCSPRVYELHKRGSIVASNERRKTRSGRAAIVWKVTP